MPPCHANATVDTDEQISPKSAPDHSLVKQVLDSQERVFALGAGDAQNPWANDLQDLTGRRVGLEFATPGVTSPGFETYFPNENLTIFAAALTQSIGPMRHRDTARRGNMVLTATPSACTADWAYLNTVSSRTFTMAKGLTWKMLPDATGRKLVAG